MTLGFISKYKDLTKTLKSNIEMGSDLFLTILDKTSLRLLQQI